MTLFRWGPPNGGVECRGMKKIANIKQYLLFSRKWYKIWPQLLWNANRNLYVIY